MAEIDPGAWMALGVWFTLWLVLVTTGLVLNRREKERQSY